MMSRRAFGKSVKLKPLMFLTLLWLLTNTVRPQIASSGPAPKLEYEANLPVIFLDAKEEILDQRVPCTVRSVYPKGSDASATNQWSGVVRIHGGVSKGYAKKSFSLSLDKLARLLGMGGASEAKGSSHWLLNAAYIDRSLMRHKLAYDLFRSLSTEDARRFAVASRFVEVHLNGAYHGAYLLMERLDGALLQLHAYNSNETSHACIYKAVDHAANFSQPGHAGYEQRQPDPLVRPYWQPLDQFDKFVSSASDATFFDPTGGIGSRLDLENAIDFHLLVLLTCNWDGITKNFILARNSPDKSRFFFAPWDYDGTFGRNWNASRVEPSGWLSNHLFDRLLENAPYREKFVARWKQLREREFSPGTIQKMIDANAQTLGPAAQRNAARWPTANGAYPDKLTFSEDLAEMKSWIQARVDWLDQEMTRRAVSAAK